MSALSAYQSVREYNDRLALAFDEAWITYSQGTLHCRDLITICDENQVMPGFVLELLERSKADLDAAKSYLVSPGHASKPTDKSDAVNPGTDNLTASGEQSSGASSCPKCNGEGQYTDWDNEIPSSHLVTDECTFCKGTGLK